MGLGKLQARCKKHARLVDKSGCSSCAVEAVNELGGDIKESIPTGCGFALVLWDDRETGVAGTVQDPAELARILRHVADKLAPPAIIVPGRAH